jgi:hypothetical protein
MRWRSAVDVGREEVYRPHAGPQTDFHSRLEDVVLYGGAKGGGKTLALLFEGTRQIDNPKYRGIIFRRTYPSIQDIKDKSFERFPKLGAKWKESEHRWIFPSGATLAFGHCQYEQDKYGYQGFEFAYVGFDQLEEFTESQFRFLRAQNRSSVPGLKVYCRASANPGNIGHWWVKRNFIDDRVAGRTYETVFKTPPSGSVSLTQTFIPSTIYDNPAIMESNPQYLATLMALPDAERKALLSGDWNAYSSDCIFDAAGMETQTGYATEPLWTGDLIDTGAQPEFRAHEKGLLSIWDIPKDGERYLITADVAKGVEGGDYSAALVWDVRSHAVVARFYGRLDPVEYGRKLYGLGLYYGGALIAVEAWPGPGIATNSKLEEMRYPHLYKMRDDADETGWRMDRMSREDGIAALQDAVYRKKIQLRDMLTIDELYSFIRHPGSGKMRARESCHDDLVICAMIGAYILEHRTESMTLTRRPWDQAVTVQYMMPDILRGKKRGNVFERLRKTPA